WPLHLEPSPNLRNVLRNGPEPSRARRCLARRSEPLTARTVRRESGKSERLSTPGILRLLMQQSIHPTAEAGAFEKPAREQFGTKREITGARDPTAFPVARVIRPPLLRRFLSGTKTVSPVARHALPPCCPYPPAELTRRIRQSAPCHDAFAPK